MSNQVKVTVEFKGGMELLFGNETRKELVLPIAGSVSEEPDKSHVEWTIKDLINLLKDQHLKERPELFVVNNSIRPGVLILVNDVDWEILGENEYKLTDGDKILFISTLHDSLKAIDNITRESYNRQLVSSQFCLVYNNWSYSLFFFTIPWEYKEKEKSILK